MSRQSKKKGRPTKYLKAYDKQAANLCEYGATDDGLANFFGVSPATIDLWKQQHPSFLCSIKKAKEELDNKVERSLYERAVGYTHPDVDIRTISIGEGFSKIVQTPLKKHYPPDTAAAFIWLKNRRSAHWRDKVTVEHEGGFKADPELISAAREVAAAILK